jgi:hypothetical protein
VARAIRGYQLPDGHFVTRTFRWGLRHTTPFLRWPQAQLFLSLTNVLRASGDPDESVSRRADDRAHSDKPREAARTEGDAEFRS